MTTAKKFKIEAKNNKVELFLYGEIESAEQAELLGLELKMYESNYKTCVIRVNTVGGSVPEGFAMWNLLLSTSMAIEFVVDGIAASMGGVLIQLPGAKAYMARYSKLMLHRICGFATGSPDEMRASADMAEQWENDIIEAIANKTGKSTEEVKAKWFDGKDHWISAQDALTEGLIDGIVDGNKSITLPQNVNNAQEAYTYFNNLLNPNEMEFKNKAKFVAALGLGETASDDAVLEAALKAVGEKNTLTAKLGTLEGEKADLQAKVDVFEQTEKDARAIEIKNLLDTAVGAKKMTGEMREHYEALFEKDFEATKKIVKSLPSVQNLSSMTRDEVPEDRKGWTFKDWHKKDSKGLSAMKKSNFENYKALFKAEYGKDPE